jgi:hypothetical protein
LTGEIVNQLPEGRRRLLPRLISRLDDEAINVVLEGLEPAAQAWGRSSFSPDLSQ